MKPLHSCLYEGFVRHRRFKPKSHAFCNRLFLFYLDLDEIQQVFNKAPFWSTGRWNLARFYRSDYLGNPNRSLADCVRDRVREQTGQTLDGPIRMLTHVRYFGFVFNPISLYYCFDRAGESLRSVVAEVTNTPWRERHSYVIPWNTDQRILRHRCPKSFHVSPFLPMDLEYRWRLSEPGERLLLHLQDFDHHDRIMDASMMLKRKTLSSMQLAGTLIRFPWMTGQVIAGIYWQALRLWLKQVPHFPHSTLDNSL